MGGYQNFLRRMNAGGNTMRNEQIENSLHLVRHTFADDPSYIPDGVQVWNSERILHPRIYQETYRSTSPEQAQIQTMIHEPIYKGDVILGLNMVIGCALRLTIYMVFSLRGLYDSAITI